MAAGLAAQAVAGAAFTPMDVIKERLQTQRLAVEAGAAGAREFRHAGMSVGAIRSLGFSEEVCARAAIFRPSRPAQAPRNAAAPSA